MPFKPGVYHENRARFHFCKKCGKRFEEGETIFRRRSSHTTNRFRTVGYYCVKCHNSLYI